MAAERTGSRMGIMGRCVFITLTILLWSLAACIACEAATRLFLHRERGALDAYITERLQQGQAINRDYIEAHPAPANPVLSPDVPVREAFCQLDRQGRMELAAKRQEIFLACDIQGGISGLASPPPSTASPQLRGLTARLEGTPRLYDILATDQREDAQRAVSLLLQNGAFFNREYQVPLEGALPEALFDFTFFLPTGAASAEEAFFVVIEDSVWEIRGQKFRPNISQKDKFDDPAFTTNAVGLRDYEIALPKPEGVYRIVCIGGSTTFEGPRIDLTYPKMLERMLREAFDTDRIQVVNGGIPALDSIGEREQASGYLALAPDLIIHYNFVNDFCGRMMSATYPTQPHDTLAGWLKRRLGNSAFVFHFLPRLYLPRDAAWLDNLRFVTMDNIRKLGRAASEQGVEVALCSFAYPDVADAPRLEQGFFDERIALNIGKPWVTAAQYGRYARLYADEVKRMCEQEGWTYVPVAEKLTAGSECFIDICHLYCPCIERKAEIIFEGIRDTVAGRLTP